MNELDELEKQATIIEKELEEMKTNVETLSKDINAKECEFIAKVDEFIAKTKENGPYYVLYSAGRVERKLAIFKSFAVLVEYIRMWEIVDGNDPIKIRRETSYYPQDSNLFFTDTTDNSVATFKYELLKGKARNIFDVGPTFE